MFTGGNYMKRQSGRALLAIKLVVLIGAAISLSLIAQKLGWLNSKPLGDASGPPASL